MKKFVIGVLIAVVPVLLTFYLTHRQADIRYSLSDKIPADYFDEISSSNIQLLDVINIGNIEAKDLYIIITGKIEKYKLEKPSELIKTDELTKPDRLEIHFSSLPAQTKAKLILKSSMSISESDIQIRHSQGIGRGVFSRTSALIYPLVIYSFVLIYFLFLYISYKRDTLSRDSESLYSCDNVLKRGKPIYVSSKKWHQMRFSAIQAKLQSDDLLHGAPVESSNSYIYLSNERPDFLDQDEWKKLLTQASAKIEKVFRSHLVRSYISENELESMMKIQRPNNLAEKTWRQLMAEIDETYLGLIKKRPYQVDELIQRISAGKPDFFSDALYAKCLEYLNGEYFKKLLSEIGWFKDEPLESLKTNNLDVLFESHRKKLFEYAYRLQLCRFKKLLNPILAKSILDEKPSWINDDDYNEVKTTAQLIVNAQRRSTEYREAANLLAVLAAGSSLPLDKPETLPDKIWKELKDFESGIVSLKKKFQDHLTDEKDIAKLKDRVLQQLRVVDEILKDPTAIDRIEDYDNVFASGNFENLKRIASLLRTS